LHTVGRLAYELEIPKNWKIHPVISVTHLEPAAHDSYDRTTPVVPDVIHDEDGSHEEWEVEEILRSRWRDKKNKKHKQYYVKWKGYRPEDNQWLSSDDLKNSPTLVSEFEAVSPLLAFVSTIIPPPNTNPHRWSSNVTV
jgi:hypothetical protein